MEIKSEIFRAYDIRGQYPDEIHEDLAYRLGRAYVQFLRQDRKMAVHSILVNRDTRASSESLQNALMRGLSEENVKVLDGGISTTPMHYFGVGSFDVQGGIMITASHGVALQNGFKISTKNERIAHGTGLEELYKRVVGEFPPPDAKQGEIRSFAYIDRYSQFLRKFIDTGNILKQLNVVIDASAGATGVVLKEVLQFLPINATRLFFDPDPLFQVHSPNPLLPESQEFLKNNLKKTIHDFGVLFDGDGDRVIFFDELGRNIPPDCIAALIASEKLKHREYGKILLDVNASRRSKEYISDKKGIVETVRVGTAFFRNRLEKDPAVILGSESSGHYYYPEFFNSDAAILTFIYMMNILNRSQLSLSELTRSFFTTARSGEINFFVPDKKALLERVEKLFSDGKISKIDGLMIEYPDWWFTIRPSNTEDLVRLHLEAETKEILDEKRILLEKVINE